MQYLGVVMRFTLLIFFQSIHTLHEALVTVPLTGYACQCMCCNVSWAFHTQHQVLSAMIAPCPHGSGCILYFGVIQKCWLVKSFALLSSNVFTCNIILESFLFMFKHINLYYLLKIKSKKKMHAFVSYGCRSFAEVSPSFSRGVFCQFSNQHTNIIWMSRHNSRQWICHYIL